MHLRRTTLRHDIDKLRALPLSLSIALGLAALSGSSGALAESTAASQRLEIVTTTTVFADIVGNIGGDHVHAVSIIPAGVGPEDYEPRPEDAQLLSTADLIVSNGAGLDDFLQKLLQSGTGGQTPQLVLGDGIPTLTLDGVINPHFWLDPSLVATWYVPAIAAKLGELDPASTADYDAAALGYIREVATLDAELFATVATIPTQNRRLVTFHDAYPYLARHYGFELVGVILENVGQEPTAAGLAQLIETVKAAGVKAVFSEAQFSPELAQTLADEAGITTVVSTLYNDALGPAPADTYLGMMRFDMDAIAGALR